jgi:hypothetical protein
MGTTTCISSVKAGHATVEDKVADFNTCSSKPPIPVRELSDKDVHIAM